MLTEFFNALILGFPAIALILLMMDCWVKLQREKRSPVIAPAEIAAPSLMDAGEVQPELVPLPTLESKRSG